MRDDTAHAQGAPKGNAATAASVSGRPQQGPLLAALAVGTDLWAGILGARRAADMHWKVAFYDGDAWFVRRDRLFTVVDLAAA